MIYLNLLLLIGNTLAYKNYKDQEIWTCNTNQNPEIIQKLNKFDVFSLNKNYITLRLLNQKQKDEVNNITDCKIIIKDLNSYFGKSNNSTKFSIKSTLELLREDEYFKDYRSYSQIKTQYRYWANKYSKYAKFIKSIGKSHEGRDIFAIEVTGKSSVFGGKQKKNIVYVGGQHAREWISHATVAYITYNMLKDAETDAQVRIHLDNFVYRIVPILNPDGYEYSRNSDRFWRKNRRYNGNGIYGVDTNRNWDYKWSLIGSSADPNSEIYHGPSATSEPEVKAVASYMKKFSKAYGAIDWHSYSQVAGYSWGWTSIPSNNNEILQKMGKLVVKAINEHGYNYTSGPSVGVDPVTGALDDYMAVKLKAVSMTLELCPRDDIINFELPPDQIIPCACAVYSGHKAFSQFLLDNPNIPPIKDIPF